MKLFLEKKLATGYKNKSQVARILTEDWVKKEIFCPSCGREIIKLKNNQPVADFFCQKCEEEYELKSEKKLLGNRILDGAYQTMAERLKSNNNPNFFFLNYDSKDYSKTFFCF